MSEICEFLRYKLAGKSEIPERFRGKGVFIKHGYMCISIKKIEIDFRDNPRGRKSTICNQVVSNYGETGLGLIDFLEMGRCPYSVNIKAADKE